MHTVVVCNAHISLCNIFLKNGSQRPQRLGRSSLRVLHTIMSGFSFNNFLIHGRKFFILSKYAVLRFLTWWDVTLKPWKKLSGQPLKILSLKSLNIEASFYMSKVTSMKHDCSERRNLSQDYTCTTKSGLGLCGRKIKRAFKVAEM